MKECPTYRRQRDRLMACVEKRRERDLLRSRRRIRLVQHRPQSASACRRRRCWVTVKLESSRRSSRCTRAGRSRCRFPRRERIPVLTRRPAHSHQRNPTVERFMAYFADKELTLVRPERGFSVSDWWQVDATEGLVTAAHGDIVMSPHAQFQRVVTDRRLTDSTRYRRAP